MRYDPEDYHDASERLCAGPTSGIYALDVEYTLSPTTVDGTSQMPKPGAWVRCWMYVTDDQVTDMMERRDYERQRRREGGV